MHRLAGYRFRRTTVFTVGCAAVLVGLGAARRIDLPAEIAWLLLPLSVLSFRRRGVLTLLMIVALGLAAGCCRGSVFMEQQAEYQALYGQKISITARAINDGVYEDSGQISFEVKDAQLQGGDKLVGKIKLSGFGANAVFQDDIIKATGKVYPTRGSAQARMSYAQLEVLDRRPSLVPEIRRKFAAGLQTALPQPVAPFALGILVGQRATLPDDVKQDLLMVGLTHIIAVSGYNLTIILHATRGLFGRRSKRIGIGLSLGLIAIFLLITGASASIVRAAIVSSLSIWAAYYGRSVRPLLLIGLAAAITGWANPFYIWSDIGWYLSFLAFFGVLVLAPMLMRSYKQRWRKSLIALVATESICAEIMTMPLVLYIFGQMSLAGLPANLLVVTLMPLAMLLSLIAGLSGMLAGAVSGWFAWPAAQLLTYMLDTAHLLAGLPYAFLENLNLSLYQMLGLYVAAVVFTLALYKRQRSRFLL